MYFLKMQFNLELQENRIVFMLYRIFINVTIHHNFIQFCQQFNLKHYFIDKAKHFQRLNRTEY